MKPSPNNHRSGFTIIEISLALVIIGLLIGGIVVGRELIKAAALRKIVSTVDKYNTAVITFRIKYNSIPGDLNYTDSAMFFTPYPGCNASCGDGNKIINHAERQQFWYQLFAAGLNDFQPGPPNFTNGDTRNSTLPGSHFSGTSGYIAMQSSGWWSTPRLPNYIIIASAGVPAGGSSSEWASGALTPLDAINIDSKMDDGLPNNTSNSGARVGLSSNALGFQVVADQGYTPANIRQNCFSAGVYSITNTDTACMLRFKAPW